MNIMKIVRGLFLFLFISANIHAQSAFDNLAQKITSIAAEKNIHTLAIFPAATNDASLTQHIDVITNGITSALVKNKNLTIVERESLNKILKEQELGMSGMVDPSKIPEVGRLLSVDAVVLTSFYTAKEKTEMFVKLVDTQSSVVLLTATESIILQAEKKDIFGTWRVEDRPDLERSSNKDYQSIIFSPDKTFEIEFIDENSGQIITHKGKYKLTGNQIDYRVLEIYLDYKKLAWFRPYTAPGTVYMVDKKLYFTYIDFKGKEQRKRERLDAMDLKYRNTAVLEP